MSQNANNNSELFDGSSGALQIVGTGKLNGQVCFEFGAAGMTSSSTRTTAWLSMRNVFVDKFQNAFNFNPNNVFIMRFWNCTASGCDTIIRGVTSTTGQNVNAGEQIDWFGCAFHNSGRIMALDCQMNMEFHGCSFDYGTGTTAAIYVTSDYQKIRIIGGWIEAPNSENYPFLESTVATYSRLHVDLSSVLIYPRNKKQNTLFKGPMWLSLTGCTFIVNRFNNYPSSADATYQHLCDAAVYIKSAKGNVGIDQSISLSNKFARNRNSDFSESAVGTVISTATPSAIKGWTHQGGAGSSTATIQSSIYLNNNKSLQINADGTFLTLKSGKFGVNASDVVYANTALKTPADDSVAVNITITYYDFSGDQISTDVFASTYTDYPAELWVTPKAGLVSSAPVGAASADLTVVFGSYSSAIYVDKIFAEIV